MIILVCGGRDFINQQKFNDAMDMLNFVPDMVVQGGARGADRLGRLWAKNNKIHFAEVPALWDAFGKSAGPERNSAMLLLNIDYCIAFPGGYCTANMVKKCRASGITTWLPYGV